MALKHLKTVNEKSAATSEAVLSLLSMMQSDIVAGCKPDRCYLCSSIPTAVFKFVGKDMPEHNRGKICPVCSKHSGNFSDPYNDWAKEWTRFL